MNSVGNDVLKVFMLTYDHGAYIRQAIESVLMQQVDIPVLLVIGEDRSTDNTREIVMEMAALHPGRIKLLLHEKNLGLSLTGYDVWDECLRDSTYVAVLDGDDHWTDRHKLQKQIDVLRRDRSFSMCFHNAWNEMPDGTRVDYVRAWLGNEAVKERYTTADIITRNFVPSLGVVFRNGPQLRLMDRLKGFALLDYTINVVLSMQGDLAYLDEVMGVRRVHAGGMLSMRSQQYKIKYNLGLLKDLNTLTDHRFSTQLTARKRQLLEEGMQAALTENDGATARGHWRAMRADAEALAYPARDLARNFLLAHFPGVARWWARQRMRP